MNQKLKSEETQLSILESAFAVFYEKGYMATTIPDIVNRSGLSKGAFYHHFKDKKEVGEKVISYVLRNRIYAGMIEPVKGEHQKKVIPLLVDLFEDRINGFSELENRFGCPLNNLINELACTEPTFKYRLRKIVEEWKKAITALIVKGQERGEVRKDVDATQVAVYLISAFEGARGLGKLYDDNSILKQYLSGVVKYINMLA